MCLQNLHTPSELSQKFHIMLVLRCGIHHTLSLVGDLISLEIRTNIQKRSIDVHARLFKIIPPNLPTGIQDRAGLGGEDIKRIYPGGFLCCLLLEKISENMLCRPFYFAGKEIRHETAVEGRRGIYFILIERYPVIGTKG